MRGPLLVVLAALFASGCSFDGKLGHGCDPGNEHCTYEEWQGCLEEIDLLDGVEPNEQVCRFIYEKMGGR